MRGAKILDFLIPGYQAWRSRTAPGGGGVSHAIIETADENAINTANRAHSSLADIRDFLRNSSFGQSVLNQLQVNIVGTVGGRLAFDTADEDFNELANREWARYARFCGFSGSESLNRILRDLVGCLFFNGGDALVVFDDGRITGGRGTGKLLVFESDQIANAPDDYFAAHFPASWTQERGIIYDQFHRRVGFFASAKRGLDQFPVVGGVPQFLTFVDRHPDLDPEKRPFYFVSREWRPNQGRGVAAIIHVLDELRKLNDMGDAETDAALLNASVGLAIKEDASAADALIADAVISGQQPETPRIKFDAALRRRAAVLQLPKGRDVVSFDTKRPNDRIIDFIESNKAAIIAVFGLGKQFFTLNPEASFTAHRGAMQMAWQTIRQTQCDLAAFCNWLASQWFYWRRTDPSAATRLAVTDEILADIDFCVEWSFPEMPEVDSAKHESTKAAMLQNGSKTYRDLNGPNWKHKVRQRAKERAEFAANGEVYPGDRMATGGVVDNPAIDEQDKSAGADGKPANE